MTTFNVHYTTPNKTFNQIIAIDAPNPEHAASLVRRTYKGAQIHKVKIKRDVKK